MYDQKFLGTLQKSRLTSSSSPFLAMSLLSAVSAHYILLCLAIVVNLKESCRQTWSHRYNPLIVNPYPYVFPFLWHSRVFPFVSCQKLYLEQRPKKKKINISTKITTIESYGELLSKKLLTCLNLKLSWLAFLVDHRSVDSRMSGPLQGVTFSLKRVYLSIGAYL